MTRSRRRPAARPSLLCGPPGLVHRITHLHREYHGWAGDVFACRSLGRGERWRAWVRPSSGSPSTPWERVDVTPAGLRRLRHAAHLGRGPRDLDDAVSALSRVDVRRTQRVRDVTYRFGDLS